MMPTSGPFLSTTMRVSTPLSVKMWRSIGRWGGGPVREILDRVGPLHEAKYLAFHSFGMNEYSGKPYHEYIALEIGRH